MSHVATIKLEIKDIDCLAKACARLGLEFRPGQTTYKWFGKHVGDYPMPEGFSVDDLGKCEHAIGIPGEQTSVVFDHAANRGVSTPGSYEVGLVRSRTGPGWTPIWDFIDARLVQAVGKDCCKLKQAYAAEVAVKQARMQGFGVREEQRADGSIRMVLSK